MDFGKKILAYSSTFGIVWLERKIVESDYERIKCFVLDFNISGRKDVVRSFPISNDLKSRIIISIFSRGKRNVSYAVEN